MITKTGADLASWVPAIMAGGYGALRADSLTEEDKQRLAQKYDISPNANFRTRNALRGVGGLLSGAIGAGATLGLGTALANTTKGLSARSPLVRALTVGGGALGAHLATNKYSHGAAQKLRQVD